MEFMEGLKELLRNGYIHRDVKPANVLNKDDVFKVADFGFAIKTDFMGKTLMKDACGSPMYEAP